jgi:hypothetical protein
VSKTKMHKKYGNFVTNYSKKVVVDETAEGMKYIACLITRKQS